MRSYIFLIFFISIWSVVSKAIWQLTYNKEKQKLIEKIKIFVFFFALNYAVMSVTKLLLGHSNETLFESFWAAQLRTYLHYGIPIGILAIIVPICVQKMCKKGSKDIIVMSDAVIFAELLIAFVLQIEIKNIVYCLFYTIAVVIGLIYVYFVSKKKEDTKDRKDIGFFISAWGLWIVLNIICVPNELFLGNLDEFPIVYWRFLLAVVVGGCIIFVIGTIGSYLFFTHNIYTIITLFLFGSSTIGYVQSMFLNGKLAAMDGESQTWTTEQKIVNFVLWFTMFSIIFIVFYFEKNIAKIYKMICIYIIMIQIISSLFLTVTTDTSAQKVSEALTTQSALKISEGKNVIVFVLDRFDGEIMDDIIEEDEEFLRPLKDFIYYENAVGEFAHTATAVPYLLTGTVWKEGTKESEYAAYAYPESEVLHEIAENGYRIGIYTDVSFIDDSVKKYISNYSESVQRKCNVYGTIKIMSQSARYQMAPFFMKARYSYYTRDIIENITGSEGVWNIDNDIPFYQLIKREGLSLSKNSNEQGAFQFYHLYGVHPPFRMTEEMRIVEDWETSMTSQAKGALNIVYSYIEQLKELGKYDEATIAIIADHGIQIGSKEGDNPVPLIMIKESKASFDSIRISGAPVSQAEFVPTILEALELDRTKYGKTYAEVLENENRVRMHIDLFGDEINQYIINENVKNPENWSVVTE